MREIHQSMWRGRSLATRKDSRGRKYMSMVGQSSLLFIPIDADPNMQYHIFMEMRRESGNGKAYCNMYANKNFDFQQVGFECESTRWSLYEAVVSTGEFPKSLPITFRIWRPANGSGNIFIRKIMIEPMSPDVGSTTSSQTQNTIDKPTSAAVPLIPAVRAIAASSQNASPEGKDGKTDRKRRKEQAVKRRIHRRRERRETRKRPPAPPHGESQFYVRETKVAFVFEEGNNISGFEEAFSKIGFHCSILNAMDKDIKDKIRLLRPDWIHFHMFPGGGSDPPYLASSLREASPHAILTAWSPETSSGHILNTMRAVDYPLAPKNTIASWNNEYNIEALLWNSIPGIHALDQIRNLGSLFGFRETLESQMPRFRVQSEFRRVFFGMKDMPEELTGEHIMPSRFAAMGVTFRNCMDFKARALDFQPDWIHIHLSGLPTTWRESILDLRRKLPKTLFTIWYEGKIPIPSEVLELGDVDFVLVGDPDMVPINISKRLAAVHWSPPSDGFIKGLEELGKMLRIKRKEFLRGSDGKDVDMSVFIGTFNRLTQLKEAISCALSASPKHSVEIIVNDAGSTDGTLEWLQEISAKDPRIRPIYTGKRTSFTEAFNESLRFAKGRMICWLSDDIMTQDNSLSLMCEMMEKHHPSVMGAFPIKNPWEPRYGVRRHRGYLCPTVGCMYSETIKSLHGINTDYPYYSQDTDLDYRVLRLGWKIIICKGSKLRHDCASDELRIDNIRKHENQQIGERFELVSQQHGKMSCSQYPTVLLRPNPNADSVIVRHVIKKIKNAYRNSYIFADRETSINLDLPPFIWLLPGIYASQRFDLVLDISENGTATMAFPTGDASCLGL